LLKSGILFWTGTYYFGTFCYMYVNVCNVCMYMYANMLWHLLEMYLKCITISTFCVFYVQDRATTEKDMTATISARKGKLNLEDKVKSKKYGHSFVKDIASKGKAVHSFFEPFRNYITTYL